MSVATLCLLAVLVVVEVARLVLSERDRRRPVVNAYVGRRIALHRKGTDVALMGVLKEAAPDALVMVRVNAVTGTATTPLDGEQIVERSRIDFFQVLDAEGS